MKFTVSAVLFSGLLLSGVAAAQTSTGQTGTSPGTSSSTKMSQSDCTAAWKKMDTGGTGISQAHAQGMISDFKAADTNGDGKLPQSEFNQACEKGLVSSSAGAASGTGARKSTGTGTSTK